MREKNGSPIYHIYFFRGGGAPTFALTPFAGAHGRIREYIII